jgi:hypothetical protein
MGGSMSTTALQHHSATTTLRGRHARFGFATTSVSKIFSSTLAALACGNEPLQLFTLS